MPAPKTEVLFMTTAYRAPCTVSQVRENCNRSVLFGGIPRVFGTLRPTVTIRKVDPQGRMEKCVLGLAYGFFALRIRSVLPIL